MLLAGLRDRVLAASRQARLRRRRSGVLQRVRAMEVEDFTPVSFAANDSEVLSVVRFRARSRRTGKTRR